MMSFAPEMYRVLLKTALDQGADMVKCEYRIKRGARHPAGVALSTGRVRVLPGGVQAVQAYLNNGIDTICCDGLYARRLFDGIRFVEGRRHEDTQIIPRLLLRAERVALVSGNSLLREAMAGQFHVIIHGIEIR
jgi:hypothetical protein